MDTKAEPNSALLNKDKNISKAQYLAMLMKIPFYTKNELEIQRYLTQRERQASDERSRHC